MVQSSAPRSEAASGPPPYQDSHPLLVGYHRLAGEPFPRADPGQVIAKVLRRGVHGHVFEAGQIGENANPLIAGELGFDLGREEAALAGN
jgi:hypothetical protein